MAKWPFVVTFLFFFFYPLNRTISHRFTISNDSCVRLLCQIGLDITARNFFVVSRSKWEISLRWRLNHARLIFPPSRVILPGSSFKRNISEVSLKREQRILRCNFRISSCLCNSMYSEGIFFVLLSGRRPWLFVDGLSSSYYCRNFSLFKLFIQRFLHLR